MKWWDKAALTMEAMILVFIVAVLNLFYQCGRMNP